MSFNPLEVGSYCYVPLVEEVISAEFQSPRSRVILLFAGGWTPTGSHQTTSFNPLEVGSYCYFGAAHIIRDPLTSFNPLEVGSYCYILAEGIADAILVSIP